MWKTRRWIRSRSPPRGSRVTLDVEEAALDVEVFHLLHEVGGREVGLLVEAERGGERRRVVVLVPLEAGLEVGADVDADAEGDQIVGEDEVVRERRPLVAERAEAQVHRGVGGVERLFVGAVADRDAVAVEDGGEGAQARRGGAVGVDDVEDAALEDARAAGGDVDDHEDAGRVVGLARGDRGGGGGEPARRARNCSIRAR